ncbi:malate dehydrogenase [Rhypophila decipiens]|uniref:Malate dehydrogenase n=1 Tax=Rhypophila decipiens TaxID=261697 RepID=A0AAN6XVD1_9PEZI|nr:malate dehydrogenase [Rhypophila decipiens]
MTTPTNKESASSKPPILVSSTAATKFTTSLLTASSVPPHSAQTIADALVLADLRGVESHGINRLPSYLARLRAGILSPTAEPTLTQTTLVVAQIDGQNAFGFLSAQLGIDTAISMARTYGIGMVSVKHSNHFGMSAWIVQRAVDQGMMSLVFTNSSPALPVWGGMKPLMGVSPIACGAPGGKEGRPFILDMAPSVAARGKVYKALRRGERIPTDWGLDKHGRTTDDPAEVLDGGVMLPIGGPKGSGLAIMMDVFSGVLSGSAFAGGVTGPYDLSKEGNVGHFFVVVKPDLFMSLDEFRARMDVLYKTVVESELRMAGVDRIYFPGEIELDREAERRKSGIPYSTEEIETLNKEADRLGVAHIETM